MEKSLVDMPFNILSGSVVESEDLLRGWHDLLGVAASCKHYSLTRDEFSTPSERVRERRFSDDTDIFSCGKDNFRSVWYLGVLDFRIM